MKMKRQYFLAAAGLAAAMLAGQLAAATDVPGGSEAGRAKGSGTVHGTVVSVPDRTSGSVKSGGPNSGHSTLSSHPGSLCKVGYWGIQDGLLQCVKPTPPIVAGFDSKSVEVRFQMPAPTDPYIIPILRLSGSEGTSIRVDLYDAAGSTAASTATCFVSAVSKPCNMGSATGAGASAALNTTPQLYDGSHVKQYADYLVQTAPAIVGVGSGGYSYADSYYVVTVSLDEAGAVNIFIAGMFSQATSGTSGTLVGPIVGQGSLTASYISGVSGSAVYTMNGWFK